jgi:hypothetical protein
MKYPYREPNGHFGRAIVQNLPKDCSFVTVDHEVEIFQFDTDSNFDTFFVIQNNGEIVALWGMYGIVSTYCKPVYRLKKFDFWH